MTGRLLATDYRYPFISSLRLSNFKSVTEGGVDLAPFTLVVGENSSGKSTLLHALHLLSKGVIGSFTIDEVEDISRYPIGNDSEHKCRFFRPCFDRSRCRVSQFQIKLGNELEAYSW